MLCDLMGHIQMNHNTILDKPDDSNTDYCQSYNNIFIASVYGIQ